MARGAPGYNAGMAEKIEVAELPDALASTTSGGGPVIVLPAELASAWRGTQPPKGAKVPKGWSWGKRGGPVCDYDRSCDAGRVAWLDVGGGRGLSLDAELVTTWVPTLDGGVIVRGPGVDGSEPEAVVKRLPKSGWKSLGKLTLKDGRLFMFDSAAAGAKKPDDIAADDGVAIAEPGAGEFEVSWASQKRDDFVRFARVGGAVARKPTAKKAPTGKLPALPWKLRRFPFHELAAKQRERPKAARGLSHGKWREDGTVIGLEKIGPRRWHIVHFTPSGAKTQLTAEPSDYQAPAFASDGRSLLVGTSSGKVLSFELPAKGTKPAAPRELYANDEVVWFVAPVADGRIALTSNGQLHLLAPKGARFERVASAEVLPNDLPMLDVVGGGRFGIVHGGKKNYLYAFIGDTLKRVEEYVQTKRGMQHHNGVSYFYDKDDDQTLEEVLNFDEVYASLTT
ncbi:MAG: hypothetical protein JNK82_06680 [Myxococcaceae bacterium]|nr:hypothetical protein [Myxococcaceae bacterium]